LLELLEVEESRYAFCRGITATYPYHYYELGANHMYALKKLLRDSLTKVFDVCLLKEIIFCLRYCRSRDETAADTIAACSENLEQSTADTYEDTKIS
jgi:hypothetical protein